ncbi:MAG: T9SS type A sorting domain-containing protein [Bacteroidetes bacterium]|nr:T9SS type A sorting domain-containing protein [Bacteroidota bacterium]
MLICIVSTGNLFASGDADVSISTAATANGSWSALSGGVYTFTPSANSAVIINTDIQNRLTGTGFTAGSITILTACSGTGSQSGNVTFATGITAATTSTTQLTFTITAAGSVTIGSSITFTPGSNAGTGYPATNIVFTGPSGVSINQPINSIGGATTGVSSTGGFGGNLTCTASSGIVTIGNSVTLTGGTGGSGGGAGPGGTGGAVTLSGQSISITQGINSYGGAGSGTGAGGTGGTFSFTSTSTTVSIGNSVTTSGGAGASSGAGGTGGAITITAATTVSVTQPVYSVGGNSGTGDGGSGGAVSITSTSGNLTMSNTINTSGGSPGGGSNKNGGTGGAVTLTASSSLNVSQPIYANAGTPTGSGTATGGAVTLVGTGGITLSNIIQTTGSTAGGAVTINDGNSTITTAGGANDGQNGSAYFQCGSINKTGSGNFNLAHTGNSWTGFTKITAGKLTLGSTSTIPDASQLYFNGGRLVMGAFSETVGTVMVNDYSVLDLPAGNYTLTCSASNGVTWTTGKKLGVNNWIGGYNGTAAGGSDPKFRIGTSTELDATHLAGIYFRNAGGTHYTATQLGTGLTGEVVPTATLPVELISFNAKEYKGQVELTWTTASEINSDYFEVFRSEDNITWELIGKISAAGNSSSLLNYSFMDHEAPPGISYYQLIERDFDGTQQKSNIVYISKDSETAFQVFPNPVHDYSFITFHADKENMYSMKVIDALGKLVFSTEIYANRGENSYTFSMENFANGVYSVQLYSTEKLINTAKVLKLD